MRPSSTQRHLRHFEWLVWWTTLFALSSSTGCSDGGSVSLNEHAVPAELVLDNDLMYRSENNSFSGSVVGYPETMQEPETMQGNNHAENVSEQSRRGAGDPERGQNDSQRDSSVREFAKRRIIFTSTVDLVVTEYSVFERELPLLVETHNGYFSGRDTHRRYRNEQTGRWVIRVPVESYDDFLSGVAGLGFAERRVENAKDVSKEFVDIDARIRNKKELEKRLLSMLEERTGKLSDLLQLEGELARVREEIERMEGRLRYLKNQTTMATVTIHCREERQYEPASSPTFLTRIGRSWTQSLQTLLAMGQSTAIAAVAIAPWLVLILPVLIMLRHVGLTRRKGGDLFS